MYGHFCPNGDGPAGNGPDRNIARGLTSDNDNTSQAAKEFAIKICASTCLFGAWGIILSACNSEASQGVSKSLQFPACFDWGPKFPW